MHPIRDKNGEVTMPPCLTHLYDLKTGKPERGRDGEFEERTDACLPPCRLHEKFPDRAEPCPKGTPEKPNTLTPEMERCYEHYLECKEMGPTDEERNDALIRENAVIIGEVLRDADRHEDNLKWESMLTRIELIALRGSHG